jgi:hypothetical protein
MLSAGLVGETRTSRRRYAATEYRTIIPKPVVAIAGGAERIAAGPESALVARLLATAPQSFYGPFTQRKPRWLVPLDTSPLPRVPTM